MRKKASTSVRIVNIGLIKKTIQRYNIKSPDDLKFKIRGGIGYDSEMLDIITVILHIDVISANQELNIAEFIIQTDFHLDPISDVIVLTEKNKLSIVSDILDSLNGMAYSTARGIIFMELSQFNYPAIIPTIDPKLLRLQAIQDNKAIENNHMTTFV